MRLDVRFVSLIIIPSALMPLTLAITGSILIAAAVTTAGAAVSVFLLLRWYRS
jgi:hypothetical protein